MEYKKVRYILHELLSCTIFRLVNKVTIHRVTARNVCFIYLFIFKGVEDDHAAVGSQQEVVVVEQQPEEQLVEAQTAVVSVVEAGSQEVLHQVHFTMEVDGTTQEQQVSGGGYTLCCMSCIGCYQSLKTQNTSSFP